MRTITKQGVQTACILLITLLMFTFLPLTVRGAKTGFQSATVSGTPTSVCNGTTVNLSLTITTCSASGGNYTYSITSYQWQSSPDNSAWTNITGATSATYAALPVSSTYYRCVLVVSNTAGCGATGTYNTAGFLITVNPTPTITLGANPTVCQGVTSASLTYSATSGSPNQYSINYDATAEGQGFVDVTDATLPASPINLVVPAAAAAGTYNYTVTIKNSTTGCVSTAYAKTITINTAPTITLGTNPSICRGTTSANLTYSATTGSPNQYSITYDATALGQGFVNVTNQALPASPIVLVVPAGALAGTYNFTLTVRISSTGCTSTASSKTVTLNSPPTTAAAGSDQNNCSASTTLAGNNPTSGTGTWSVITGSASFANANLYNTGVTGLGLGANTLRWTISSSGCTPSTDDVIITNNNPTTPFAGTDQDVCGSTATLAGNPITIGTGLWSLVSGSATITSPTSPTSGVTALGMGANTLRWTATNGSCTLFDNVIVSRNLTPATPGAITGITSAGVGQAGLIYSISAVTYATTYTWTVPTGWTITSGNGTTSIIVTAGALGQNGNITVTAGNSCGTSIGASSLAVSVIVITPHNNCNQCHIFHDSFGNVLTIVSGNANLCISCHNTSGTASSKPFNNSMKAIPGTSGTSHGWDKNAINTSFEAYMPTNSDMLLRITSDTIICSTCHNQHSDTYPPYLRISNAGDAMCKDCHYTRNVGRYADNPLLNKGSHPVGLTYNGSNPDYNATPTSPLILVNSKIECSSCHSMHYSFTTDGYLLRATNNVSLCTSCHTYGTHNGMDCLSCHQTHNTNKSNIYMIRNTIATPNSGNKTVVFTSLTGTNSFADGNATYNGICEVCHTSNSKTYHYNTAAGIHTHEAGNNCTTCHTHKANFTAPNCEGCHNAINTPTAGIYTTDAHSTHVTRYGYACSTCHFGQGSGGVSEPTHPSGGLGEVTFDPNGLAKRNGLDAAVPTYSTTDRTCTNIYCHSDGRSAYRGTDGTYTWSGTIGSQTPTYATAPNWYTGSITACSSCHSGTGNMISPYTITSPGLADPLPPATGSHLRGAHTSNSQELSGNGWAAVNCFWCHNSNSGNSTPTMFQGTYGTTFHVDGQTYFKPLSFVNGGTMVNATVSSGGTFSYSATGSAGHCGNGKTCW